MKFNPKVLGKLADELYSLREAKAKLNKQVAKLEEREGVVRETLIENLPKSSATGVSGQRANAKVVTKQEPQAKDWPTIYKWILKTKDFSVLNRAVNRASVRERWEDGRKVPGIEPFTVVSVSVTAIK
jgi:hypothetical protein